MIVISFEPEEDLRGLADTFTAPFHFVSDPERRLYEAYGTIGGEWWRPFVPATVWAYIRGMLRGRLRDRPQRKTRGDIDWKQLGGDYVVDSDGRLLLAHPSENPADRPSVKSLLGVLSQS